ncbi:MAG: 4-phosphoerythronate dehydrogenase [Gammaproteobacteria bacterium]|nr:MAG: 4-phosphoerythronate dehydrogenase [Gammaproteobacteria bacterium]
MNITADKNIPYVCDIFKDIGEVKLLDGREICQKDLIKTDILLVRSVTQVNKNLIKNTPIKFVSSATAGIDHVDLEYLKQQNIGFSSAPGSNAISASEYVISAICYWSLQKNKKLTDLTLGIIGAGNVGSQVEKYAKKLQIETIKNDPPLKDTGVKNLKSLDEVLKSDIITLHTPLTYDGKHPTYKLINKNNLKNFKKNQLLINAARGGVVCEQDLLKYRKDINFSYIFDVWEGEPIINHEVLKNSMLGTAHIAGYSIDGKIRGSKMIYESCCDFFNLPKNNTKIDIQQELKTIDFESTKDIRFKILSAYDIKKDNDNLKKILTTEKNNPKYFDNLRKNYPIRREFNPIE